MEVLTKRTSSSSSQPCKTPTLSDNWPCVLSGNELVWSSDAKKLETDVVKIKINNKKTFADFDVIRIEKEKDGTCGLSICFGSDGTLVTIDDVIKQRQWVLKVDIPEYDISNFSLRATRLCKHCINLTNKHISPFGQFVRESVQHHADSDDEQFEDEEILPAFTDDELTIINYVYRDVHKAYHNARAKLFQNEAGKNFFGCLGKFLMLVKPIHDDKMLSRYSTNPCGPAQPGACSIQMTRPKRDLRNTVENQSVSTPTNMVADYILYNANIEEPRVVGEIKTEEQHVAENQNIYQMLAHFREHQTVMFGFTANRIDFVPRLLLFPKNSTEQVKLFILEPLNITKPESIVMISKLIMLVGATDVSLVDRSDQASQGSASDQESASASAEQDV